MKRRLKLAVLGSPISHSRSPELHSSFARDCGFSAEDFSYERIEATEEELTSVVKRLVFEGYDGFNCTMPLKTEMAHLADELSHEAKILDSVNTVTISDGRLFGDTTDGVGILRAAEHGFETAQEPFKDFAGMNVTLIGAGGAARSAALSLKRAGANLTICNRTIEAAVSLSNIVGGCQTVALSDRAAFHEATGGANILINCTSLGMSGRCQFSDFDFLLPMKKGSVVIDAVYHPAETELLRKAAEQGLTAVEGIWMLIYQGAASFERWTGISPDETALKRAFDAVK